ncbi:MAG: hypothetical protein ABIC04_05490 [Nanoarchaeota archaeon]
MINKIFDQKTVILNDGKYNRNVKVYLKEVNVRNNFTKIRAFCKIVD